MKYSLRIHPIAHRDAEEIVDYLAERSLQGMLNWLDAYEDAQKRVRETPLAYGQITDKVVTQRDCRQVFFKTRHGDRYRAVFVIEESEVIILRIRSKGQQELAGKDIPIN